MGFGHGEDELTLDGELLMGRVMAGLMGAAPDRPRLGRFEIVRRLGGGGQGDVYEARDPLCDAPIALKLLNPTNVAGGGSLQREFRALADIVHPNLIVLHELFCLEQRTFFTMELLSGVDFVRFTRACSKDRSAGVNGARVRAALVQLLRGVAAMHGAGKVHRDLKPSNVLVEPGGRVVIIDYGLTLAQPAATGAAATAGAQCAGTAGYLAPECVAGQPASAASDMYSLGAILLEALTGARPCRGRSLLAAARALEGPESDLIALCQGLLASDPRERPSAAAALARLQDAPERTHPVQRRAHIPGDDPFVGRTSQLAALRAALARVRAGGAQVVLVHGASGMGKSALLSRFRAELREDCLVLSGRCYERESTPYKVLDGLLPDLVAALERLPAAARRALLPTQATASLRILPELSSLRALLAGGPDEPLPDDPRLLRDQAFVALRELLRGLSAQGPLVVIVDDLQWGDRDSASLIAALFAGAEPLPLLFLGSYRSDEVASSPFLDVAFGPSGFTALSCPVQQLPLEPLDEAEVEATVHELARRAGAPLGPALSASAGAARGLPFLLRELVAHALLRGDDPPARDASALISLRMRACTPAARQLLEVLCVAGRPLSHALAASAADPPGTAHQAAAELCLRRLARTRDTARERCLEPYHDIVRGAVLQALPLDLTRTIHQRLAHTMRRLGVDEPEHLLGHLLATGEQADAGEVALEAAERAARRLAWGRAVELLGIAQRMLGARAPTRLLARQAELLSFSARHAESAAAYLQASECAGSEARAGLQRLAVSQYLRAGLTAEGIALFRSLLREVGLHYPERDSTAVLAYIGGRIRQSVQQRALPRVRARTQRNRERLATLDAAYRELWLSDPVRGGLVHLWFCREARSARDASYVRASLAEIMHQAMLHGWAAERTISRLERQLERLVAEGASPYEQALVLLARAFALIHCRFRPGAAMPLLERADTLLARDCPGTQFEHAWLQLAREYVWHAVGNFRALVAAATPRALAKPQDGYGLCQQLASVPLMLLIQDRPAAALDFVAELAHRNKGPLRMLEYAAICCRTEAMVYAGEVANADALLRRDLRWKGGIPGARTRVVRLDHAHQLARNAAALYRETRAREHAREVARHAAAVRALPAMVRGHVRLLEASVARVEGREHDCRTLYRVAIDELSLAQAEQAAWCARYRLAQVDGSRERLAEADAWFRQRGIHHPARWVSLCAPGREDDR